MKLKSKLIATIVSMCAAIAVMGVGVWASSSQSFQITVKNDIDVKIISVDADVYGEFAVYSQFSGHTVEKETNAYAQAYHHTVTGVEGFDDRKDKDHGYLLYARGINGYNDGVYKDSSYWSQEGYEDTWYYNNVQAVAGSGYQKYVDEAKREVYFATAESEGVYNTEVKDDTTDDGSYDKAKDWAEKVYNIDFNTRTAQITYMYTIRQWKMATASAATNEIHFALKSSISKDSDLDLGPGNDDNKSGAWDAEDSPKDLTNALINANGTAGIFIDAYIAKATDESATDGTANSNKPDSGLANGTGVTTNTLNWYRVDLRNGTSLPESTLNETYYIVLTYTFARTGANLDLSGLANAVEHTLVMTPPGKLKESGIIGSEIAVNDYKAATDPTTGSTVKLCYATGLNTSQTEDEDYYGNGYQIYGNEFVPNFTPAQITSAITQTQLNACFAESEAANLFRSNILAINENDDSAAKIGRPGYIFATRGDKNKESAGITPGVDHQYIPITETKTTGWYVKQLNDGVTINQAWNTDSNQDQSDLTPTT